MGPQTFWQESFDHHPFAWLTTTGRTSGKPHRIEIWFAHEGNRIYLLSGGRDRSDWVRNLIANPVVTFEMGGETFPGVAQVLDSGSSHDQRARELLVAKYQKTDELRAWGRTSLGVVIILGTSAASTKPTPDR